MPPEALTIPQLLKRRIEKDAESAALVCDEDKITYAGLERRSAQIATLLIGMDVVKGSRVALLMENCVDWICIAVAAMRLGAVLVPLSTLLRPPELAQQLNVAAATHLVLVDKFRNNDYLAALNEILPGFDLDGSGACRLAGLSALKTILRWQKWNPDVNSCDMTHALVSMVGAMEDRVAPADDMAIIFTSGSSGAPKGVIHTHGNALRAVSASLGVRCVRSDDRLYLPMPFFWMGGFATGFLSALSIGATLLSESVPESGRTLKFLAREGVTLFRGWPDQAVQMAAHPDFAKTDLSRLRPGSLDALMPAHLKAKSPKARASLFGMTETFGPYCGDNLGQDMPAKKWGSCGRPVDGVEVRVVDPETRRPVPRGALGAIQVRGPNVMRGMCGRTRTEVFDKDDFYATGDLGVLDEDNYLFYKGRSDDALKIKGVTVYPSEVESALHEVPGVQRAFAIDVLSSASDKKEIGAAVVLAKGGLLSPQELTDELSHRLSAFKIPTRWLVVETLSDIPTLASGKVDKARLRRALTRP